MKGVSVVVVMILLLLISISFSSAVYMFMIGSFSGAAQTSEKAIEKVTTSQQALMRIESMSDNRIFIRNIGRVELQNITLYVDDMPIEFTIDKETIASGEIATITLTGNAPAGYIQISTAQGATTIQGGFSGYTAPVDNPPQYVVDHYNPTTYSSTTYTWMNATWTDDNGINFVRIESNHSGPPVNYTPTQIGSLYYLRAALPAGAHRWRSFANDTANQWTISTTQTFTINRATSTIRLYINGSEANFATAANNYVNYTSQVTTPSSGNVELWTNYSNGVSKRWYGPLASPMVNLTNMISTGIWYWFSNYTGNQNYTGDLSPYLNVTVT